MADDEREDQEAQEEDVKKDRESAQAAKSLDKLTDHVRPCARPLQFTFLDI